MRSTASPSTSPPTNSRGCGFAQAIPSQSPATVRLTVYHYDGMVSIPLQWYSASAGVHAKVETIMAEMAMVTPWGVAQTVEQVEEGFLLVETASHGGVWLDAHRNAQVPEVARRGTAAQGGWYEQDVAMAVPVRVFFSEYMAFVDDRRRARGEPPMSDEMRDVFSQRVDISLKNWQPDFYEHWYGATLDGSQSIVRRQEEFAAKHANDWVVTAVVPHGSPRAAQDLEPGMIDVRCTRGGRRDGSAEVMWARMAIEDYRARQTGELTTGVVIDPYDPAVEVRDVAEARNEPSM